MSDDFYVRIKVRGYEIDTQGHLNQAEYLHYAEHARWSLLDAAGIGQDALVASGFGPVVLETTIKYHRELRGGDEVDVGCAFTWGDGKVFRIRQVFLRPDRQVCAELDSVNGLLDLTERKLATDPAKHFRTLAANSSLLGL